MHYKIRWSGRVDITVLADRKGKLFGGRERGHGGDG